MNVVCEKAQIAALLSGHKGRHVSGASGDPDTVVKGNPLVEKGVQYSCVVRAFHTSALHYKSCFFLLIHLQVPLFQFLPDQCLWADF